MDFWNKYRYEFEVLTAMTVRRGCVPFSLVESGKNHSVHCHLLASYFLSLFLELEDVSRTSYGLHDISFHFI
jgi:hypothetical protein